MYIFERRMRARAPDLAVISQGENFDGLLFVHLCRKIGLPYVLVCQKASDMNWPGDSIREAVRRMYVEAQHVYFVSQHNFALTELQIACKLTNAEVVHNPFQTKVTAALPYPDTSSGRFRLACVARLFVLDKGQDTLLTVLAQPKWRDRNLEVNFYGQGIHREALIRSADMLGLQNVFFPGFTNDITDVWRHHHALVLPSRAEGLPLALVEAMLCGRPGIVTNVGGNAEVVEDGKTGFLARGMDAVSLDEVLEKAWHRRAEWEQIGLAAATRIRQLVPADPCSDFTAKLKKVTTQLEKVPAHAQP
jgi:glycosyltransferase involved in cell wall biosynthesis